MLKRLLPALLGLAFIACSSASKAGAGARIDFVQVTGPAQLNYPGGAFDVQYGMRITNLRNEPITLRQIYLEPIGTSGPYLIRRERYFFKQEVAAAGTSDIAFWAHARATGNAYSIDAQAPVSIRATAYFESPSGAFQKVILANLAQGR